MREYDFYDTRQDGLKQYMARTYLTMAGGLLITFVVSLLTALFMPVDLQWSFPLAVVLLVLEVIVAIAMGRAIGRAKYGTMLGMFIFYAVLTGVSLSYIFVLYDISRIFLCFLATSLSFGMMALLGYTTKKDLSPWRNALYGGLVGLLVLSIVGVFLRNAWFEVLICMVGLVLFLAITAYDSQKLKAYYMAHGNSELGKKLGIYSALQLFLDFINIFLYILRLFGRGRD